MKKILVPIDFSEYANNAMKVASYIAKVKGMTVKLLHVLEEPRVPVFNFGIADPTVYSDLNHKYTSDLYETTQGHMQQVAEHLRSNDVEVEYEVVKTSSGIVKEILKHEADLIIIGTKRNEESTIFFGSITEKIIRLSSIPVLTVGELFGEFSIKNILFASDFEEAAVAPIIERIIKFSAIFGAQIHFIKVDRDNLPPHLTEKQMAEIALKFNLQEHTIHFITDGDKEETILNYADEVDADIISLCTHGRTGVSHFVMGSLAEDLAIDSNLRPVLIYNIGHPKTDRTKSSKSRESIRGMRDIDKPRSERKLK